MDDPFRGIEVIHTYTSEDAVEDGLKVKIGNPDAPIYVNTNLADYLGCTTQDGGLMRVDADALFEKVRPTLLRFLRGDFYDKGATDYPEEANEGLAVYYMEGKPGDYHGAGFPFTAKEREVVWVTLNGEGLHFYFPADH